MKVSAWRVSKLRDDPEGGQFAASLKVSREVTYGYDDGLISFEEGWLVYAGKRCTFSLPASAVRPVRAGQDSVYFTFGPAEDERKAVLTVVSNAKFGRAAKEWRDAKELETESVVLPPLVTDTSALSSARSLATLAGVMFALSLGALLILHVAGFGHLWALVNLGLAVVLGVGAFETRRALRALSGRRPSPLAFWARPISFGRSLKSLPADTTLH